MRRFSLLLISLLFIVLLTACGDTRTTTGSTSTPTTAATTAPTATPVPTHAPTWTTVQKFSGNGSKKTKIIQVPDDWKILYSCTGGEFGGVLLVTIYDSHNTYVDGAVNATCKAGSKATTGETEEHQSGSVYLDVNGTGDWSLQVQALK